MKTGYSNKSLPEKLGIKKGMQAYFFNCPFNIKALISYPTPDFFEVSVLSNHVDFILGFTRSSIELKNFLAITLPHLSYDGMIWIAWPKKESRMPTDLTENTIRDISLEKGIVDVKVISIDETWSALKFMYRLSDRKKIKGA